MRRIYSLLFACLWFYPAFSQVSMKRGASNMGTDRGHHSQPTTMKKAPEDRTGVSYYGQNGKYGFVQKDGKRLEPLYDSIVPVRFGSVVCQDGLWGLVDKELHFTVKPSYQSIEVIYSSLASVTVIVKKQNKFGLMDLSGHLLTKVAYDQMTYDNHLEKFVATSNGLKGTLTKYGHVILPTAYKEIFESDSASYSIVKDRADKLQIIDQNVRVHPVTFDRAIVYRNAIVLRSGDRYGAVWKDEKEDLKTIVPVEYDAVYAHIPVATTHTAVVDQKRDLAHALVLLKDGKYGLMDNQGNVVYPVQYDYISWHHGFYKVKKGKLYGAYFVKTKRKLDVQYSEIDDLGVGTFPIPENSK